LKEFFTLGRTTRRTEPTHSITDLNIRSNHTCFLDTVPGIGFDPANREYTLDRLKAFRKRKSPLHRSIYEFLENCKVKELLESSPFLLLDSEDINTAETQISRYGNGQFFRWHNDYLDRKRLITLVYYFHKLPKKFSGGELVITNQPTENAKVRNARAKKIACKNDRLVIFSSTSLHRVRPTYSPPEFQLGRFSANVWIGIH
jgi:Rps23 Pro-64 3,4-dihydroxylase Tpa1-like proline 4-hydroxylase